MNRNQKHDGESELNDSLRVKQPQSPSIYFYSSVDLEVLGVVATSSGSSLARRLGLLEALAKLVDARLERGKEVRGENKTKRRRREAPCRPDRSIADTER